jgi:hypothetical protein
VAIDRFVDTGATTGGDGTTSATSGATRAYASLSEWEANGPWGGDGTEAYSVSCAATDTGSGNVADTTGTTINFVSITSGSITVQTTGANRNTSDTFIDESKYRIIVAGSCIVPSVANITLRGLQMDCTSASSFVSAINLTSPGRTNGLTVEYCRIRSAARAIMGHNASNPAGVGTMIVRNNIFVLTAGAAAVDLDSSGTNNGAIDYDIYHNTIYTNGAKPGVRVQDNSGAAVQTVDVKNNIVANTTDPFDLQASSGSLTVTTDYNATDNGTDGTTNEINLQTGSPQTLADTFTAHGTTFAADFSLVRSINAGAQVGSITDDITGTTRADPPDVGAYEFVDAGGSVTGEGAGTLPSLTGAASGSPIVTGTAAGTLPSLTGAAAGSPIVSGTAEGTLPSLTGAAAGSPVITGTAAGTLPSLVGAGSNDSTITGTGEGTLPSLTGAASGSPVVTGTAAGTLPSLTGESSGSPVVSGLAAALLPSLSGAGAGTPIIVGTGAGTLPSLTGSATDGIEITIPPTRGVYTKGESVRATFTGSQGGPADYTGANT